MKRKTESKVVELIMGKIYACPYPINIRGEDRKPIAILEHDTPFVVLAVLQEAVYLGDSKQLKILTPDGFCGSIFANLRHVKEVAVCSI